MNQNVRKITEGAMMVALYGIVLLLNRQLAGTIEFYFMFVLPIPLVVYSARYGLRNSLIVCASVFFLAFMVALPQTYFYIVTSLFVGIIYGSLVRKKVKNGLLIAVTMSVAVLFNVLTTLVFASFFGFDIQTDIVMMRDMMNQVFSMMGTSEANLSIDVGNIILVCIVLGPILTGIMEGLLVHMLSNILLKRLKIEVRPFRPLVEWVVPKWTGYVAFIAFSSGFLLSYVKIDETTQIIVLVAMIAAILYLLVFGYIASVVFGMVEYKKNIGLIVILACLLLSTIVIPFLCVIGFFYISADLRERLLARRNANEQKAR